jgi:murein DD-endopeptidase MepM/ murein hydrolase activator NlpD
MKIEIKVPQLGLTTEYVVLKKWNVQTGQKVKKNMPIAEIESGRRAHYRPGYGIYRNGGMTNAYRF